ncbi:hypothetical protein HED60_16315 [Planctomycetales bacterium ZRK34]|nr:hypothetical protein HED60_16315 [Planctomycetales bacterium ZRK34]
MEPADSYNTLCTQDQAALDALVEAGFELDALEDSLRERGQRVMQWMGLLDHLPTEEPSDLLVAKTMAAIENTRHQEQLSQHIDRLAGAGAAVGSGGPMRVHLRELVATAAMFLIGVSLLWPMLASARSTARQVACQSNLANAGLGLTSYAADNLGAMPATAAKLGSPWWLTNQFDDEGNALSNSAHLFVAVHNGYVPVQSLSCAANPDALAKLAPGMRDWPAARTASFSYQNQYASRKPRIDGATTIALLADKNPFFEPGRFHFDLAPNHNSFNHGQGQNVLMTNGQVMWLDNPKLANDDNIFHAGNDGFDNYTGLEGPADIEDSFLVP